MFKHRQGGTIYKVKDAHGVDFDCCVPPLGYGICPDTGVMERTDIIKRSTKPSEQYWEREDLPEWYAKKRAEEEIMQDADPDYEDPDCAKVRETHWKRRLYGCWIYMNGKPVYLTGLHWFVLNWWMFQGKFFDFRIPNMEYFYALAYCMEDPNCLGLIEITKRKEGKSARAGAWAFDRISRRSSKHAGIQSKGRDDAAELFNKGVVMPWTKLPHFFRPKYDTSAGTIPKKELRFFNPSKKGVKASKIKEDAALESFIDFKSADVQAYDGPELDTYISDECGKLVDISIADRHDVVKFCSEVDGKFIGKHIYTTTVEEMESGGSEFQRLVKLSDRNQLDANGRTKSGLYVYFLPAYRTLFFDKYGVPDEEKGKAYYLNTREGLKDNPRNLSSFIRKNPFTLAEAFRVDGDKSLWNPEKLNEQLDWLNWHEDIIERGNLEWKNGERFTEVVWVKNNTSGRWMKPVGFTLADPNKVESRNGKFFPKNNINYRIGCDPFKYNKTKDERRSDCAFFVGKMLDPAKPSDPFNDALVMRYRYRAATTSMANEDMLKTCWFFGCQTLVEKNVDHWLAYFIEHGCYAFLMKLDGEDEPGIYSDGHGNMLQAICDLIEHYIEFNHKKILFKPLVEEYLEFDVGNTTKFDETIASGITLVAMKKKQKRAEVSNNTDVSRYFKKFKAA